MSKILTAAVACLILGICLFGLASGPPSAAAQGKTVDRLSSLWADLASEDESRANRALLTLSATPKETLAFLQTHLRPIKVVPERVAALVAELDSAGFAKRAAASLQLEYLGRFAKPLLEKHLKAAKSVEAKRRLEQLIRQMPPDPKAEKAKPRPALPPLQGRSVGISNNNGKITIMIDGRALDLANLAPPPPPAPPRPNLAWVRATRAVALLEHLATPEAQQLLKAVADGEPEAPPTRAAREAIQRQRPNSSTQPKDTPKKP